MDLQVKVFLIYVIDLQFKEFLRSLINLYFKEFLECLMDPHFKTFLKFVMGLQGVSQIHSLRSFPNTYLDISSLHFWASQICDESTVLGFLRFVMDLQFKVFLRYVIDLQFKEFLIYFIDLQLKACLRYAMDLHFNANPLRLLKEVYCSSIREVEDQRRNRRRDFLNQSYDLFHWTAILT